MDSQLCKDLGLYLDKNSKGIQLLLRFDNHQFARSKAQERLFK